MFRNNIFALYFQFDGLVSHEAGCPKAGSDVWEVTRYVYSNFEGEPKEVTIRLACHDCGIVHYESSSSMPGTFETTHGSQVGYGSAPERVAGLWLHAGPRMWHDEKHGPTTFYVTRAKDRPREPGDVAGVVAWSMGPRGGIRWSAGLGQSGAGVVTRRADGFFASRRGAVQWIAAELAGAK